MLRLPEHGWKKDFRDVRNTLPVAREAGEVLSGLKESRREIESENHHHNAIPAGEGFVQTCRKSPD
jgi:hypothetical protein